MNGARSHVSDGGSSGYSTDPGSQKGLVSSESGEASHRDKIGAMSKQYFQTTDFKTIANGNKV